MRVWARWVAATTVWCGAYTLVEWLFGAPVEISSNTQRLGGPFGSAAYLGAALCLLIPIAGWVAYDIVQPRGWRSLGGVGAVTCSIAVVGSGSRAAWTGLAVGGVVALIAIGRWRTALTVAGVIVIAVIAMAPRLET